MSFNQFSLENKIILITGASSGIGKSTAVECSKLGATVVITARDEKRLNETFLLLEKGKPHKQIIADLTNKIELESLITDLPLLNGFVNNAGIVKLIPISYYTKEDVERIYNINLFAPMYLTNQLIKKKKLIKPSSIVFTSSISGVYKVSSGNGIYASSKNALDAFMRTSALELASKGIRCNSVNPGLVNTNIKDLNGELSKEQYDKELQNYPLKRFGNPVDIAHSIIFLLSDASSWITGTEIKIDGGRSLV